MARFFIFTFGILLFFSNCGRREEPEDRRQRREDANFLLTDQDRWLVKDGKIYAPGGKLWRGVGANLTNLMGRDSSFVQQRVRREADRGFSFIRLWTLDHNSKGPVDMEARAAQVEAWVNEIAAKNMKVMLVLWDTYKDLWGNGHEYFRDVNWWTQDFRKDYLTWIKILSRRLGENPAIFMYQFVNESSCRLGCAEAYIDMYQESAAEIRKVNKKALLSPGGLSIAHSLEGGSFKNNKQSFVDALFKADPQVVWTNSIYNLSEKNRDDLPSINKKLPIIVTEYGFCVNSRPDEDPLPKFKDHNWGAEALFSRWDVAGITAWEAEEGNCGYANMKVPRFNLANEWRDLNKKINGR